MSSAWENKVLKYKLKSQSGAWKAKSTLILRIQKQVYHKESKNENHIILKYGPFKVVANITVSWENSTCDFFFTW